MPVRRRDITIKCCGSAESHRNRNVAGQEPDQSWHFVFDVCSFLTHEHLRQREVFTSLALRRHDGLQIEKKEKKG